MTKWICVGALAGALGSWFVFAGVACAHRQAIFQTAHLSVHECIRIAEFYGRHDIAKACELADDLAPLFERLIGEAKQGACKQ